VAAAALHNFGATSANLKPAQPGRRGPLERVPCPLGRALACVRGAPGELGAQPSRARNLARLC